MSKTITSNSTKSQSTGTKANTLSTAAGQMGAKGGLAKTEAKQTTARANGALGGRPKSK